MKVLQEYLKRTWCIGFSKSKNRILYTRVGNDYGVKPERVFQLAHGAVSKNNQEHNAKQELRRVAVLCGR